MKQPQPDWLVQHPWVARRGNQPGKGYWQGEQYCFHALLRRESKRSLIVNV